ncbi:MAG TPA: UDP-3-O-(3-hydroxymyristoyl)glucosamine N-acyltransferase [Bacteroidales bacterium]|nr:UDP-3-O-(3-hydroxymyristoyl)glucosamine N-acyltransferase [Bacteroidales bacterium]HRX97679.1 UDP-3-O-(3-hydroxymyristoyl)glucosamine N-acyltransferase [Bacteroidales bacterium]
MEFSAQQIASVINGTVEGNAEVKVNYVSKIEEGKPGTISFLANPKYTQYIYNTLASIVIVNNDFKPEKEISATLIRVEDAYLAFAKLLDYYNRIKQDKQGVSKQAYISESASIGENCYIGPFVYIGENVTIGNGTKIYPNTHIGDNSSVGDNTTIYSGVNIYSEIKIGNECIIHAGVVIGSDGFGFAPQTESDYTKVAQIGNVILEDRVEIGANTTIDRATLGSTIIRKGVKLDNLIQIAHNVEIGEHTVISAQTGVSGSTKIGKFCMIGGQVGIINHITIADEVKIAAQSGIGKSIVNKGEIVQGSPAFDISKYRRAYIHFRNLENIKSKVDELDKKLKDQ